MKELQTVIPGIHAALVMQYGEIIAQTADIDEMHPQYSVTKSLTSLAVGMLIDAGKLRLDTKLGTLPDMPQTAPLAEVTLEALLTMQSGLDRGLLFEDRYQCDHFLGACLAQTLGAPEFYYNNANTYLAGLLAEQAADEPLAEFLGREILHPLGIREYSFEYDEKGRFFGASGLHMSTRDLAKLGQSVLEGKMYPAAWLENALRPHARSNDGRDYGMGFWVYGDAFCLSGKWGQNCIGFPSKHALVAVNSHLPQPGDARTYICEVLLPCIR